jgi:acyl carrier protein
MILIEDEFADIEISENDANQIEVVGDLIRILESPAGGLGGAQVS